MASRSKMLTKETEPEDPAQELLSQRLQAGRFFAKKPSVHLMLRYRLDRCWVALFFRRISHCCILFFEPSFGP